MKKALITAFAVMASLSLYGQGTLLFANQSSSKVMWDADGPTLPTAPVAAVVAINSVGFYYAPAGTSDESLFKLLAVTHTGGSPNLPGMFNGGAIATDPALWPTLGEAVPIAFQIRAWTSTSGATYEAALAGGVGYAGKSAIVSSFVTGAPTGSPPTSAQPISDKFTTFTMNPVPEPSTIALGLLGLAGLFVLRRRS